MKSQKLLPVLLGILMIFFGALVLFDTLEISPRMWVLPVAGATLLVFAVKAHNKAFRDIGISVIINELFIHPTLSHVFYLFVTAVAVFVVAILRKSGWLTLLGTFALLISGIMILDFFAIPAELEVAYTFILVATALVVLFIVKSDKLGYAPLVVAILCYLMSLPRFLMYAGYIGHNIAQIISSLLLILSGALLVIMVYKKTAKENERE